MTNISHKVWKILDRNPSIQKEMSRGLINMSALARYLITKKKVDGGLDAVISAVRRYEVEKQGDVFETAYKLFVHTVNISTKSNLAEISLIKDDRVQQLLPRLFDIIKYIQGDVLRIMQANESIRLLIDEKNMDEAVSLFPDDKIISTERDLAEVDIYTHPQMQNTPGILAVLANELAINGINILEFMTCSPEMVFFVKKEDVLQAYNVLYNLCQPAGKNTDVFIQNSIP